MPSIQRQAGQDPFKRVTDFVREERPPCGTVPSEAKASFSAVPMPMIREWIVNKEKLLGLFLFHGLQNK